MWWGDKQCEGIVKSGIVSAGRGKVLYGTGNVELSNGRVQLCGVKPQSRKVT